TRGPERRSTAPRRRPPGGRRRGRPSGPCAGGRARGPAPAARSPLPARAPPRARARGHPGPRRARARPPAPAPPRPRPPEPRAAAASRPGSRRRAARDRPRAPIRRPGAATTRHLALGAAYHARRRRSPARPRGGPPFTRPGRRRAWSGRRSVERPGVRAAGVLEHPVPPLLDARRGHVEEVVPLHVDLDDAGAPAVERAARGAGHLLVVARAVGVAAARARRGHEIDRRQLAAVAGALVVLHPVADLLVAVVVEHDHDDRELVVSGDRELREVHERAAVADRAQDLVVRPGERNTYVV